MRSVNIKEKTVFETTDGRAFYNIEAAGRHQTKIDLIHCVDHEDTLLGNFMGSRIEGDIFVNWLDDHRNLVLNYLTFDDPTAKIVEYLERRDNADMACDGPVRQPSHDECLEDLQVVYQLAKGEDPTQ